jgi:cytochrome c
MAMLLGFLCLTAAGVALYTYRFTYDLQPLLHSTGGAAPPPDIAGWRGRNDDLHRRSGRFALTFLLLGCFLVMGAIAGVINPSTWVALDTLPALVIAPAVWLKLAGFLSVSLALTGAGILITLSGPRGESTALHNVLQPLALRLLATGILMAPLFLIGEIVLLPSIALSGDLFGIAAGVVLLLFLALHFVYVLARHPRPGAHVYVALVLLATTTLLATKDQIILHHATREHATILARAYATDEAKLRASFGIVAATQSGEDIYNAKCSACHLFDQKKVGPPYKEVLVKYAGKKSELVAFILNPVKVNPAYPPMPNQGLKAAEADSIARYLLEKSGPGGS